MKLLVQKFGGTSVQSKETRKYAIKQIKQALANDFKIVVVVSALGRNPEPYATDTLIQMVNRPNSKKEKRELDLLMSCGETIASCVLADELRSEGVEAIALTGAQAGIITNDDYNEAKIKQVKPDRIKHELRTNDVIVVAGFQGRTEDGDITTLGRGGSDTTAAAIGASLQVEMVEIFTDVNGIMTADPRVVKSAKPIDVVTYTEICNLAHEGAKVIHPRAVEIAMQAKIPLRIRSTYSDDFGTLITSSRSNDFGIDIPDRLVTGIAHMSNLSQLRVSVDQTETKLQALVFETMANANISVDFINISEKEVIFTLPNAITEHAVQLLESIDCDVHVTKNCAKVATVGAGMTGIPGVAAKITKALADVGVPILQSADSHTTIWVLIEEAYVEQAVNALHDAFELSEMTENEKVH